MSDLVNVETGEIAEACTPERARDLTDKIKTSLGVAWELVKDAYTERAWAALDYGSWDEYVAEEFGSHRVRLPREERREVVGSLREAGLSIRAIAAATGDSYETTRRAINSGDPSVSPGAEAATTETVRETTRTTVTGTDGKSYPAVPTRPASAPKPQRRALTDSFFDACHDLTKQVERIQRLTEDDRFTRNAEQVAERHRGDLLLAVETLSKVLDQMPSST